MCEYCGCRGNEAIAELNTTYGELVARGEKFVAAVRKDGLKAVTATKPATRKPAAKKAPAKKTAAKKAPAKKTTAKKAPAKKTAKKS